MKSVWAGRGRSLLRGDADTVGGLRRNTLVFWVWGAVFFALWSLATPLWSAPDSIAHDLRAYGAAHGNLTPDAPPGDQALGTFGVDWIPAGLVSSAGTAGCYAFQPEVSAGCMAPLGPEENLVRYDNPAGRYIPTYYAVTGLPSLVVPQSLAMPAERAMALLIGSFFLAWALAAARTLRRPALAMTGVVVACTPMVGYLGGVVNPNSLEITAMAAVGASSLAALLRPDSPVSGVLLRRALLAGSVVCITRMISPVWLAVWLGVLLVAFGGPLVTRLLERRMIGWTALPVVASVVNCIWTFSPAGALSGTPAAPDVTLSQAWELAADRIDGGLNEVVAAFGWLDTALAPRDYTFYLVASVFLVGVLATFVDRRRLLALGTLIAAAYLVPIALQAAQWSSVGPVWQGRYTLPLLVLIPILAALVAAQSPHPFPGRIALACIPVTGVLAFVHVRAYFSQLRRNVGGVSGGAFDGAWEPPLTAELQFALLTLLVVGTWLALARLLLRAVDETGTATGREPDPVPAPA